MDVTTTCPKCGLMLALDTSAADEFECPQCGQRLTVQTGAQRAKPVKRPTPVRRTASSAPPTTGPTDDIDWSIPDIPQRYKRRKRRSVDFDPAVVWSIIIVSICVVALIVGGVYVSKHGVSGLVSKGGEGRATMNAYAPDDWDVQAVIKVGTLLKHPHRNSLLLLGARAAAGAATSADEIDELLISDGAARCMILTTVGTAASVDDLKKSGGVVETYKGHEVYRKDGRAVCRISNKAIAVAENDAAMRRMIDASKQTNRSPPDPPKEYSAFFRVRTRALRSRTTLPDWMAPFDSVGVSILLHNDGGASLFLFGEATSEASAKESVPQVERVRHNFREQLANVRTLYRGTLADLEKLSSALSNNAVVQEGKRVGLRCVVPPDLFGSLFQPQLATFTAPPAASSPPARIPSPVSMPPKSDPPKSLPAFVGYVADQAQQAQEVLAARLGREQTIMVVGYGFTMPGEHQKLSESLIELGKKGARRANSLNYNTAQSGPWVACVFAPLDDIDGFARAIDFAVVAQVAHDQRRIYLTPKR